MRDVRLLEEVRPMSIEVRPFRQEELDRRLGAGKPVSADGPRLERDAIQERIT
jgi:hypothetical protein